MNTKVEKLDPLRRLILQQMEDRGTDLKSLSVKLGKNVSYLHGFIWKGSPRKLDGDDRKKLAELLGLKEEMLKPETLAGGSLLSAPSRKTGLAQAAIVAEVNVEASAGAGAIVEHEGASHVWAFPEYWLRAEMDAAPNDIKIVTIRGDSGISDPPRPTDINPGDKVLVNVADKRPSPGGLFIVHDGLGLIAKRIDYIANSTPPRVRVSSNNVRDYPSYEAALDEEAIKGRIVAKFQRVS